MSKLIDPEFNFHKVTTQVWAQLTLSFTESAVIPFNVSHYGVMLDKYTKSLNKTELAAYGVELSEYWDNCSLKLCSCHESLIVSKF